MYNTSDMINEIYRIFTALNEHYFESSLPTPFITIIQGKGKKNSFYGRFSPESWAKKESVEVDDEGNENIKTSDPHHEIAMAGEYFTRPVSNWCATLCHEMVHLYCNVNDIEDTSNKGVYHNRKFQKEAEKRGLIVDKADTIGWSVTTPSEEFICFIKSLEVNEEIFAYFRQTRLAVSELAPKKRYVCPVCGLEVQAKKGKNIICGDCEKRLDYWDLTDADNPEIIEDYNDGLAVREG